MGCCAVRTSIETAEKSQVGRYVSADIWQPLGAQCPKLLLFFNLGQSVSLIFRLQQRVGWQTPHKSKEASSSKKRASVGVCRVQHNIVISILRPISNAHHFKYKLRTLN
jgi:hypothetical protein